MKKRKKDPLFTAEKLWKAMTGFIDMNMNFDKKNGEPDEVVLKQRSANYGLIRHGIIATDFINRKGLEREYKAYIADVDKQIVKINSRLYKNE